MFFVKRRGEKEKEEKKEESEKFIEFCRKVHGKNPYSGDVPKEVRDAVEFLDWDIPPEAVISAARYAAMYAGVFSLVLVPFLLQGIGYIDFFSLETLVDDFIYAVTNEPVVWFILSLPLLLAVGAYYAVLSYPISLAKQIFAKDLLPSLRVVGNIVLSMKLVPNLEKAVSFAVEHGEGFLARTLRQVLWDTQLGIYRSIEEGLDKIAYRLGRYSDEFKHAIMRIRTSLLEADDAKRYVLLDSALNEAVEGVKNRMMAMASALYMPSIQLFYLGIFLPLLLFIIVPVWAAFSPDSPLANPVVMVLLYDLVLPGATFYFAKSILSKRPEAYVPPEIPDRLIKDYEKKKQSYLLQAFAIAFISFGVFYFLHVLFDATPEKILVEMGVCPEDGVRECMAALPQDKLEYYLQGADTTPYFIIFGAVFSIVLAVSYYLYMASKEKIRLQDDIMTMEREFKDAVYVLASRMGEGKPLESALDAVSENMPESKIASVFDRIAYNVKNLGLTLEDAIFSPHFGVLKDIPSKLLRDAMRLVVSAVKLGTELAARALAALSEQLRNEETVVQRIREKTSEIAMMMFTMAYLVAPVTLGITVALEKVIVSSVSTMETPEIETSQLGELAGAAQFFQKASEKPPFPDWVFILSVTIYSVLITALLTWFASYLQDGPNKVRLMRKLAFALLISSILFMVTTYFSLNLVKGML